MKIISKARYNKNYAQIIVLIYISDIRETLLTPADLFYNYTTVTVSKLSLTFHVSYFLFQIW